jgi:tetratricopeptide (TPR) repeat protein
VTGRHQDSTTPLTVVTGIAAVMFGIIVGYMLGVSQPPGGSNPVTAATAQTGPSTAAPASTPAAPASASEQELQAYRNALASDPKNLRANVELANRLYDAGRYARGHPLLPAGVHARLHEREREYRPGDSALLCRPRRRGACAVRRSLALDPRHGQTLYNLGIVKRDAKSDRQGAIAAWERLLTSDPDYPDAAKVRTMLAELKQRTEPKTA